MIDVSSAVSALRHGGIVVYPTDTLYGLGADIFNDEAVKQVFTIKQRPLQLPLPVAIPNKKWFQKLVFTDAVAEKLVDRFLPGPLCLVLPKKVDDLEVLCSNQDSLAIRIPDHPVALQLLSMFGPITATSANIHGEPTQHTINDIRMQFTDKSVDWYLDGGCLQGSSSTIVDLTRQSPQIIRKGRIPAEKIFEVIWDE